jgi:hypothetical protein
MLPLFDLTRVCLVLLGAVLFLLPLLVALTPRGVRLTSFLLVALAGLSCFSYVRWGEFHEYGRYGRHTYHYHEIYHYYVGSKYYPELGYHLLYDCTYIAFRELGQEGVTVPAIVEIRSLSDRSAFYRTDAVGREIPQVCRESFSPVRWQSFKADLTVLLAAGWEEQWWQTALFDLGFNPPPSWALTGTTIANLVPLNRLTMEMLPFIDVALIILVAGFVIYRAAGLRSLCAYLIIFGNNFLADYSWTGGSYHRQVWFALLAIGLGLLTRGRRRGAGVCLALSAAMRIFPLFFGVGALLALLPWDKGVDRQRNWRPSLEFGGAYAATLAVMAALSLIIFGSDRWRDFLENIQIHNGWFFVMHIGFDKAAVFSPGIGNQNFWWGEGLGRFVQWQRMLEGRLKQHAFFFGFIKFTALLTTLRTCTRARPEVASVMLGWCVLFFFNIPANYYYVFLAILPVAFIQDPRSIGTLVRVGTSMLLVALFPVIAATNPDRIIYNGYLNWAVLLAFVTVSATFLVGPVRRGWSTGRALLRQRLGAVS